MNNLYFCLVGRRDFGDLLFAEGTERLKLERAPDIESLWRYGFPLEDSVLALWSLDPKLGNPLPSLLICRDDGESDWAAWITTYAAKLRPFSAFMRLITRSEFEELATGIRTPALNRITWGAAGLIIGEVLATSRMSDRTLDTLPLNAFESTLSFSMFRALAVYPNFRQWSQLVQAWETTRQLTKQHPRSIESQAVARVCGAAINAISDGGEQSSSLAADFEVVKACREFLYSTKASFPELPSIPLFASVQKRMQGAREERVVAFSEFARQIEETPLPEKELTSFALGYLASRIAPGTIQHSAVLEPLARRYPTAMLWYGFCAGIGGREANSRNSAITTRPLLELPAIAKWITRDLLRADTIFSPPACDIAFLELLSLSRSGDDPLPGLNRTAQGTATIELVPGVWTVVNVSTKAATGESTRTAREKDLLASMGESIERLRRSYGDLVAGEAGDPEQRNLFPSKRKKL